MIWTEDRKNLLRKLWDDGLPAREIAGVIGEGVTRNAVIGCAHRMGLPKRRAAVKRDPKLPQSTFQAKGPQMVDEPVDIEPVSDDDIPMDQRKSIMELSEHDCRFVIGDPQTFDWFYCGAEAKDGSPYCSAHHTMCYQSPNRPRMVFVPPRGH